MNKRKKIIIFMLIILAIWLCFSNDIIGFLWNNWHEVKIEKINYEEIKVVATDNVDAAVDFYYVTNNVLDIFAINGWADCLEIEDSINKSISIILKSEKVSYKVSGELYSRSELFAGYATEFSMLGIDEGIYGIDIYCSDDGISYGIYPTKYHIKVSNTGIEVWEYESQIIEKNISVLRESDIKCDPGINVYEDKIELWSWAFIEGVSTQNQEVIIALENDTKTTLYSTRKVERTGVAKVFNNFDYEMAGFWGIIRGENMKESDWNIRIYISNGGKWYQPLCYFAYDSKEKTINWVYE